MNSASRAPSTQVLFLGSELTGWEMLYRALAFECRTEIIIHDTS